MIVFDSPEHVAEASLSMAENGAPTIEENFNWLAYREYEVGHISFSEAEAAMIAFHVYIHRKDSNGKLL